MRGGEGRGGAMSAVHIYIYKREMFTVGLWLHLQSKYLEYHFITITFVCYHWLELETIIPKILGIKLETI